MFLFYLFFFNKVRLSLLIDDKLYVDLIFFPSLLLVVFKLGRLVMFYFFNRLL